jgi:VIT1/CCC1 family predicted Fe2+/Mn2+ transporter
MLWPIPVALPFAFMDEIGLALRVSNGIALVFLMVGGYTLAGYAGFRRIPTALAYTIIGVLLIAATASLGG